MFGRIFNLVKRRLIISSKMNSVWFKKVKKAQSEIIKCSPSPLYLSGYKQSEISYWINIPKWIYQEYLNKKEVKDVLDIGCAYGTLALYTQQLFNCNIYLTDFMDNYISTVLIDKYKLQFQKNNIEREIFPWDKKFDIIIFTEVLEHLSLHPLGTLKKIKNLLNEDGILFLSTPDAYEWGKTTKYYNSLEEIPVSPLNDKIIDDHVWQYSYDELKDILEKCGFAIEKFAYSPGGSARHFNLQIRNKCS